MAVAHFKKGYKLILNLWKILHKYPGLYGETADKLVMLLREYCRPPTLQTTERYAKLLLGDIQANVAGFDPTE